MRKNTWIKRTLTLVCAVLLECAFFGVTAFCEGKYGLMENDETGYMAVIDDNVGLFANEEVDALLEEAMEFTDYGNIAVITIEENDFYDTADYGTAYIDEIFGYGSESAVFVIDMQNRWLNITSEGSLQGRINSSTSDVITDNVYEYASDEEYYICASRALEQMLQVVKGEKIARPMKYLSNICLSITIALIIAYLIAKKSSQTAKASDIDIIENLYSQFTVTDPEVEFTGETKEYSPKSSSSGGGGGGSHSSSGGHGF